jgi:CheY-like chemotaxis protein
MCLCVVFRGVVFRPQVMLMRKLGYEIQIASNGRECLEVLEREAARGRQHEIQCILMDASMVRTHEDTGKSRQGTGKDGLQCVMPVANWLMVLLFAHLLFFFLQDVMDGTECTRVIRAQQLPTRIKPFIIAQTANVTDDFRAACIASGMVRHARAHADRLRLEEMEDEERGLIRLLLLPCPPPLPCCRTCF